MAPTSFNYENTPSDNIEPEKRKAVMSKSAKTKAEKMFASPQDKGNQIAIEKEKRQQDRAEHQAMLRGLRLAKEAAEKKAAE
ncbi:MAG: hypothetical protein HN834_21025 [Rhodospirillaceae bacterium]|nr:hypothetical protein [Rhodospirillaceae bacterium]